MKSWRGAQYMCVCLCECEITVGIDYMADSSSPVTVKPHSLCVFFVFSGFHTHTEKNMPLL